MSGNRVEITGVDALQARVKAWPHRLDVALTHEIQGEVRPMVGHMQGKGSAIGGAARIASRSLGISTTSNGLTVKAGGGDLAGIVVAGGEYGGRKRPKRPYAYRSRSGNAYIARRRATQQFKPHLGSRGYWFWPTARTDLKGINERVGKLIGRVANS